MISGGRGFRRAPGIRRNNSGGGTDPEGPRDLDIRSIVKIMHSAYAVIHNRFSIVSIPEPVRNNHFRFRYFSTPNAILDVTSRRASRAGRPYHAASMPEGAHEVSNKGGGFTLQ
jgi:hypothetical protein